MSWIKIERELDLIKQGQDMCLYAGVETLLKYNMISDYDQNKLFDLNDSRVLDKIVDTVRNENIPGIEVDYPEPEDCTLDTIKSYIQQDIPVFVN